MPPVHSTLVEVTDFLGRQPPFSALGADELDALAASAEIEYFPRGTEILLREGAPTRHLYVVRAGAVELVGGGEVLDVLDEGEAFGIPSLLSGHPPAFTARAREDTLCLLFPADAAVAALARPEGMRFLAASLGERLERSAASAGRPLPWGTSKVRELARPGLVCEPGVPIREAAARMTEAGTDAIAVPLEGRGWALVTDRELRERVVTGEVSSDAPVAVLRDRAAVTTTGDRLAFEVVVDLLEAGAEHALVVDDDGTLVGVVDHAALLDLTSPSPLVVRREIERAADLGALAAVVGDVPRLAVRLLDAGVDPVDVLALLSATTDAVTHRLSELAIEELGEPPCAWAWLALGSEARREQSLATDQDNALAYEDGAGPEAETYFAALADRMNSWLVACGYAECRAGVMARNPGWRMSREAWLDQLRDWLGAASRRDVHLAMIALDHRVVAGPLELDGALDEVAASAARHPYFLERLAQASLERRPPLGFLRDLVVERSGEHVGTLDVKSGGVGPIVDLARRHALAVGSTAKPTLARLRAARAGGSLDEEGAAELEDAFATVCRIRLEHQAAQVEHGASPDDHVDPNELPPPARRRLKDAFRAVARAQRALEPRVATRIP